MRKTLGLLGIAVFVMVAASARAGIVDSPIPAPFTQHVFSVPGVISGGGLETFFSCTNLDVAAATVGVEVFGFAGGAAFNDPVATSLAIAPGGTQIFGCGGAAGISVNSNLGCGPLSKGSARVLATSKKLLCTAWVADPGNAPPTAAWQLNIVAKTKQKGD